MNLPEYWSFIDLSAAHCDQQSLWRPLFLFLMERLIMAVICFAAWESDSFEGPYWFILIPEFKLRYFFAFTRDQIDVWDPNCHTKFIMTLLSTDYPNYHHKRWWCHQSDLWPKKTIRNIFSSALWINSDVTHICLTTGTMVHNSFGNVFIIDSAITENHVHITNPMYHREFDDFNQQSFF